jgi:hypothetical protein
MVVEMGKYHSNGFKLQEVILCYPTSKHPSYALKFKVAKESGRRFYKIIKRIIRDFHEQNGFENSIGHAHVNDFTLTIDVDQFEIEKILFFFKPDLKDETYPIKMFEYIKSNEAFKDFKFVKFNDFKICMEEEK